MEEYVVVKKKVFEDAVKEYSNTVLDMKKPHIYAIAQGMLGVCEVILEKGKPLQPILEDAFDAGRNYEQCIEYPVQVKNIEEYIENLKID